MSTLALFLVLPGLMLLTKRLIERREPQRRPVRVGTGISAAQARMRASLRR